MRKITLLAVAALTASSALAVGPTRYSAMKQTKVAQLAEAKTTAKVGIVRRDILNNADILKAESRAEEEVAATPAPYPLYTSVGAFYIGMTQRLGGYKYQFGFAPAHSVIGFVPVVKADSYQWSYDEYVGQDETQTHTADTQTLIVETQPVMEFAGPTLKATAAGTTLEYNDSVAEYFGGGDPYFYGFYAGEDEENPELSGLVGVTPCPFTGDVWSSLDESSIDRSGAEGFNANGVALSWEQEVFIKEGPDENNDGKPDTIPSHTNIALNAISYKLPEMTAPYQLSGLYFWLNSVTTAATPITATVYGYDEEGYLDKSIVLGKGTAILPEGKYNGTLRIDLEAVNSLGLPSGTPICTSDAMWVEIGGFNCETVTQFAPVYNFNLPVPVEDWQNTVYSTLLPRRSVLNLTGTNVDNNEVEELAVSNPWVYGRGPVYFAREYAINFLASFPIVMNAETGLGDFDVNIPVTGGQQVVRISATEDIAQLYNDMEINAEASADWIDFEVGFEETEDGGLTTVTVSAEALPAGETGREGTIEFTGYACDFTVNVLQGESGISAVVANGNGASQYFDLQGRRLTSAPAKGFYIERNGTRAATKLAR